MTKRFRAWKEPRGHVVTVSLNRDLVLVDNLDLVTMAAREMGLRIEQ